MKSYIRYCDCCKKEIKNLYDFGVTTLYKNIRIGRGGYFNDYEQGSINNQMENKSPEDFDDYGKGWSSEDNKEFSFCSPECLLKFFESLYKDTYNSSLKRAREDKIKLEESFEEFKKKLGEKIPFFQLIQTKFSREWFKKESIEEADKLIKQVKEIRKRLQEENTK